MGKLEIRDLRKEFEDDGGTILAVDDLSLEIEDGEFIVMVGPSGCGKSTTLRCVAGLEDPTSGDIVLNGDAVTEKNPKNRDMAMVFQNYALYPHMTARENISFGLKMATDLSKDEIRSKTEDVAEMMGIEDLLEKKPGELSGGQQQRVALGRAIVREPAVFLMDEPLSNLDAKLRTQMRTEIQNLQRDLEVTTIYVTHDQTEAMTMGDRIVILNDGELQQVGTPLECYHDPANQFVAGFIGSPGMNFFDVQVTHADGQTILRHSGFDYLLSEEVAETIENGHDELVLGIRPEDIQIGEQTANSIRSSVNVTEPLGDITYVYTDIGGETYTLSVDGSVIVEEGEEIEMVFPEECIHLFDAGTGASIKSRTDEIGEMQRTKPFS